MSDSMGDRPHFVILDEVGLWPARHTCTPGPNGEPSFSMSCCACMDAVQAAVDADPGPIDPTDGLTDTEREASAQRYREGAATLRPKAEMDALETRLKARRADA